MVHFEDKGMFPKVHWRILEDSGRFRARIPRGLGFMHPYLYRNEPLKDSVFFIENSENACKIFLLILFFLLYLVLGVTGSYRELPV